MSMGRARGLGRAIALAAVAVGCASACASGPVLRGGTYRDPKQGWTIAAPPAGWTRVAVDDAKLAFRGAGDASLALASRCDGVRGSAAALASQLRAGLGPHELLEARATQVAGRPAQRQILALGSVRVATVTRVAAPCVQDFVLVAPREFEAALAVFDAWWASFAPAAEAAQ